MTASKAEHLEALSAYVASAKRTPVSKHSANRTTLAAGGQSGAGRRGSSQKQKRAPAATYVAPTPERIAKVGDREEDSRELPLRPHRIRSVLDQYAPHFTMEEAHTATQFLRDAEAATRVNITSSYEGAGGGARGSRTGGVGINERLRDAHRRHTALWEGLPPKTREVLTALVLEVRAEATGKVMTVQEMGQLMTRFRDKATARGVGIGVLKASLWVVEWAMWRAARSKTTSR